MQSGSTPVTCKPAAGHCQPVLPGAAERCLLTSCVTRGFAALCFVRSRNQGSRVLPCQGGKGTGGLDNVTHQTPWLRLAVPCLRGCLWSAEPSTHPCPTSSLINPQDLLVSKVKSPPGLAHPASLPQESPSEAAALAIAAKTDRWQQPHQTPGLATRQL